eukprot:3036144-Rhodomonas_salina.4
MDTSAVKEDHAFRRSAPAKKRKERILTGLKDVFPCREVLGPHGLVDQGDHARSVTLARDTTSAPQDSESTRRDNTACTSPPTGQFLHWPPLGSMMYWRPAQTSTRSECHALDHHAEQHARPDLGCSACIAGCRGRTGW